MMDQPDPKDDLGLPPKPNPSADAKYSIHIEHATGVAIGDSAQVTAHMSTSKKADEPRPAGYTPLFVPFHHNPSFVGREDDLKKLHALLKGEHPHRVQPIALSGLGGIGKTQLAIEYALRFHRDHLGGVFWLDAASDLIEQLASIARYLRLASVSDPVDSQAYQTVRYLQSHPDALVILDNVLQAKFLNIPFLTGFTPTTLGCRLLLTTRQRGISDSHMSYEVAALPEDAAMQLLLHYENRRDILDSNHPERTLAKSVCRMLGFLPLALALAAAYLGGNTEVSLSDYRVRLIQNGCIETVDDTDLDQLDLPTRHDTAVRSTLLVSWETISDEGAQLILRAAGQIPFAPEAVAITSLGLLTALPTESEPGYPSVLRRSLRTLLDASLMEEMTDDFVRLHPLVFDFAKELTTATDTCSFREGLATNISNALGSVSALHNQVAQRGVDDVLRDLQTGLELSDQFDKQARLAMLERILSRSAHRLRGRDITKDLAFLQYIHSEAVLLGFTPIERETGQLLQQCTAPHLRMRWYSGFRDDNLA